MRGISKKKVSFKEQRIWYKMNKKENLDYGGKGLVYVSVQVVVLMVVEAGVFHAPRNPI